MPEPVVRSRIKARQRAEKYWANPDAPLESGITNPQTYGQAADDEAFQRFLWSLFGVTGLAADRSRPAPLKKPKRQSPQATPVPVSTGPGRSTSDPDAEYWRKVNEQASY